jgi:glutathione synthase/RimK-type ligase-like ATP-grasp enzyme
MNGLIYFKNGSKMVKPDLIFRRIFGFFKKVKQYVFNPSEAGAITQNKFKVHEVLKNVARYSNDFYQPISYKVNNKRQLMEAVEDIFSMGKDVVIKPLNGYGGKEVKVLKLENFDERAIKRLGSFPKLVQEKIEAMPIESGDGFKYLFDIRSIVFGGKFAGFQLRRSGVPINCKSNGKYVTNVSAGGSYIHAFIGDSDLMHVENLGFKVLKIIDNSLNVDGNVAVFDYKFFKRLERASILITKVLAKEISERLQGA